MGVDILETWKIYKACWDKKFYVIQKPMGVGIKKGGYDVQLIMDMQGQLVLGKDSYKQNSQELEDKITEMYTYMYKRFIE